MRSFLLTLLVLAPAALAQPQLARISDAVGPRAPSFVPEETMALPFGPGAVFSGRDASGTNALWTTDGTAAGTVELAMPDNASPAVPSAPMAVFEDQLYFNGLDASSDSRLWRIGPEGGLPEQVTNAVYERRHFRVAGDVFYFVGCTPEEGCEPYVSNGQSTSILQDINPGAFSSSPSGFTAWQGGVYFVANDGQTGREPWVTAGTEGTTRQLEDVYAGTRESRAGRFAPTPALLYFIAEGKKPSEDAQTGLWATDGTEVGTQFVADAGLSTYVLGSVGGELAVAVQQDPFGQEPHRLTGSTFQLLADIGPGTLGGLSNAGQTVVPFDGELVFTADGQVGSSQVRQIWATDGTSARQITIPSAPTLTAYDRPLLTDDALYFVASLRETTSEDPTVEVWRLTSASATPERIGALPDDHTVQAWAAIGDKVLLSVSTAFLSPPSELWGIGYGAATSTDAAPEARLELAAFPSPTSGHTTLRYVLATASDVRLSVVDALGREVAVLATGRQPGGAHEIAWTPHAPASGVYLVRLQTDQGSATHQLVVVR